MSLHNYTNPAFCQQSEFYPSPSNSVPNKSPIKIYRSESVRSFKQTTRIRQQQQNYSPIPPKVGPKPQVNLSNRYAEQPFKNTYEQVNASAQQNATSVEYALVPLTEIPISRKGRYACIPADDVRQLHQNTTRFTRSQDDLDRFSSLPANVNDHDDSITSLPPCPTQDNPRLKTAFSSDFKIDQHSQQRPHDNSRLQAAFSSDFGNKSFIVVDQNSQQRYEIVPTEEDEELVDANHEIIQMHNGRAHRYAMIPTDDEETCLSSEFEMSPIRNTNNYATIKESPRYQPPYKSQQQRTYVHQSPQKDRPPATPTKNALVTQKLHELLSTPQKTPLQRQGSTLRATPVRHNPPVLSSTPKQTEFTPQKLRYEQHQPNASQIEQRTTAVISPRLASLATYVEPSSVGDNSSWKSLSFQKVTNATATIGAVSLMLILCGIMNSGLCLYMIADFGRIYYLDIGVISGFAATALGILGFKSRQCDWLPNRNYVSGNKLLFNGPLSHGVMKALCYAAKLMSGLYVSSNADKSKKFAIFSSKISGARATLRLIDDIPMLKYTLEYGWGQKEPDRAMSVLGVIANFVDHLYYPIEKICWLIEHKLLNVTNPTKWDTLSSVFWVSSIYLNLMRTMRMVALIEHHKQCVSSQKSDSSAAMEKLINNQRMEVISVIRLSLDLIQAGSTLPKGYLWGGKLETWHVGLVGTLSAFIGIYQYFAKKRMAK